MFKTIFYIVIFLLFIFYPVKSQNFDDQCRNPNNELGICINIRQCPPLVQILLSGNLTADSLNFLRNSQCGFEGSYPKVCCHNTNSIIEQTSTSTSTSLSDTEDDDINSRSNLLPNECGRDLKVKLVGGEKAGLNEFPWMALLEYQKPSGRITACGGVLISKRYVLTAAHCIKGKDLPKSWRLLGVRLGEYDTSTDIDCIEEARGQQFCADPMIQVGVEEQIAHENYAPLSRDQRNDIALIRLNRDITFTDYIKPICLPSNENIPEQLWVAGWGKTENTSESNIKLKLKIPLFNFNDCLEKYESASVNLGTSQICAGGQHKKDSCRGDSGGPLMSGEKNNKFLKWTARGIVSFGPSPCGMQGWPGVYTKISDYTDWILRNIRV